MIVAEFSTGGNDSVSSAQQIEQREIGLEGKVPRSTINLGKVQTKDVHVSDATGYNFLSLYSQGGVVLDQFYTKKQRRPECSSARIFCGREVDGGKLRAVLALDHAATD